MKGKKRNKGVEQEEKYKKGLLSNPNYYKGCWRE